MSVTPRAAGEGSRSRPSLSELPANVPRPRPFRPYADMARVAWENRDQLGYAWRILMHGVCDGCSLGPRGIRDDVISGVHLCMTRLNLMRLNTMGTIPETTLRDLPA